MKLYPLLFLLSGLLWTIACNPAGSVQSPGETETVASKPNRPSALLNGKFFTKDDRKYLFGGERADQHFDVTNCDLKIEQFHYGLGREAFPALLEPEFISVETANAIWQKNDRFLVARIGNDTRAYSIKDLTRHEVVNDVIDGRPVFAAYCILADLGAMYDRTIGGREYTFALSGYTYFDPKVWDGMDGFVMWDRETESLWWPLIGEAVSGKMKGTEMIVLDEALWKQTTWGDVLENHPDARVLRSGQNFARPLSWHRRYDETIETKNTGKSVAPEWGANKTIKQ
ncbi:DUF3179 domain-containing (seleno)protein [Flavilitoribacter nigricans]|uniref:DUF3179 domain-containing protein n=1 Tax=Flavilitoribacter nigricans (strain ATCC 23147 / DSM 23189 / NBRC 102662 / NCIMB 1420 / SS-2) TaxID=1122177 RepID=A0A2D0N5H4_FLAN2|nr:DUF3179 domain-containing (seleno)protein [Flavilitoribacter nigricans]PHN03640.1 hypothetical protein CRP01_25620 [Flavilitoribacter nigricans DSM 23189 = NBRC 102662]